MYKKDVSRAAWAVLIMLVLANLMAFVIVLGLSVRAGLRGEMNLSESLYNFIAGVSADVAGRRGSPAAASLLVRISLIRRSRGKNQGACPTEPPDNPGRLGSRGGRKLSGIHIATSYGRYGLRDVRP